MWRLGEAVRNHGSCCSTQGQIKNKQANKKPSTWESGCTDSARQWFSNFLCHAHWREGPPSIFLCFSHQLELKPYLKLKGIWAPLLLFGFLHCGILYGTLYDAKSALLFTDEASTKLYSCCRYAQSSLEKQEWLANVAGCIVSKGETHKKWSAVVN